VLLEDSYQGRLSGKTPIADTGCTALGAKAEYIIGFFSVKAPEDDEKNTRKNQQQKSNIDRDHYLSRAICWISK